MTEQPISNHIINVLVEKLWVFRKDMVVRRSSLPVIFYLDSFFSRLLGESLDLSEEATAICNPVLPVNFILNFLNSTLASSCSACLWLFHLLSPHLIRFIWVEYSHYSCLNQLSSLLFASLLWRHSIHASFMTWERSFTSFYSLNTLRVSGARAKNS